MALEQDLIVDGNNLQDTCGGNGDDLQISHKFSNKICFMSSYLHFGC